MTDEQPATPSHRRGTDGILDEIVVDFKTTVPQVALECFVFV
jgi:hypothetical protein